MAVAQPYKKPTLNELMRQIRENPLSEIPNIPEFIEELTVYRQKIIQDGMERLGITSEPLYLYLFGLERRVAAISDRTRGLQQIGGVAKRGYH